MADGKSPQKAMLGLMALSIDRHEEQHQATEQQSHPHPLPLTPADTPRQYALAHETEPHSIRHTHSIMTGHQQRPVHHPYLHDENRSHETDQIIRTSPVHQYQHQHPRHVRYPSPHIQQQPPPPLHTDRQVHVTPDSSVVPGSPNLSRPTSPKSPQRLTERLLWALANKPSISKTWEKKSFAEQQKTTPIGEQMEMLQGHQDERPTSPRARPQSFYASPAEVAAFMSLPHRGQRTMDLWPK